MPRRKIKTIKDYKCGEQVYYYHGDGSIFQVEVLNNFCGQDAYGGTIPDHAGYELRILKVLNVIKSTRFKMQPTVGPEFSCEKICNISCAGSDWELSDKLKD